MCTVVLLIRPGHVWPVVLAANRDERLARAWDPPGAYWPNHPGLIAGRDRTAGGTWMGLNRQGVVAAVLNRQGSLGPAPGKRSRGELPLIALSEPTAERAAAAIAALDAGQWRGFNFIAGDAAGVWFVRGPGHGHPQVQALSPGLHMITSREPDDPGAPRVARHMPRFAAAEPPGPITGWGAWQALLSDQDGEAAEQLNVVPRGGYGTVCASLMALPDGSAPVWLFAPGPPHAVPFRPVPTTLRDGD